MSSILLKRVSSNAAGVGAGCLKTPRMVNERVSGSYSTVARMATRVVVISASRCMVGVMISLVRTLIVPSVAPWRILYLRLCCLSAVGYGSLTVGTCFMRGYLTSSTIAKNCTRRHRAPRSGTGFRRSGIFSLTYSFLILTYFHFSFSEIYPFGLRLARSSRLLRLLLGLGVRNRVRFGLGSPGYIKIRG